jgi:tRNA threonylcarbamoyladenosine biosynthesis protein TsaB
LSYLFIDSTYELLIGVLDDGMNWLSFERYTGQKASAIIQKNAFELLKSNGISPQELSGIITVNGPGFYTGLRLAEGFADVFSFFGVKTYSFYSYEIPRWCGHQSGGWFTKAYRGEYYLYQWDGDKNTTKLYSVKEIEQGLPDIQMFIHTASSLDEKSSNLLKAPISTFDLLKEHPEKIFKEVLKGPKREPFYFRAPEDEFKVNP